MYTPTDLNKQKAKQKSTLRWVSVNDFWLEISAKADEPPLVTIHLGFVTFRPPMPNDGLSPNTLIFTTKSIIGEWDFIITTNNRFEIIDFNKSLIVGKQKWENMLVSGPPQLSFESLFKDKNYGFLGGKNVECSISPEGFKMIRSQTESLLVPFESIEFIRPVRFDTRKGSCFEIRVFQAQNKPDMVFQCHDHTEMKKFLTIFLFHLSKFGEKIPNRENENISAE